MATDRYIFLYNNNPTENMTDGDKVSTTNPIANSKRLNAETDEESTSIKLAIRCDSNFQTDPTVNTVITPKGTNVDKWALSLDGVTWGNYGAALTIPDVVNDNNRLLFAKNKATSDEDPDDDISVTFDVSARIIKKQA